MCHASVTKRLHIGNFESLEMACRVLRVCNRECRWRQGTMDREQLIQRLRARVRRGGPAEQVWWNGELLHVSEAIMRAADLSEHEPIRARGDDVVIPRQLVDAW